MAEEKEVGIKIKIDAAGGQKSLSELKKEFKETQQVLNGLSESSEEYIATLKKLGGIKDDIGDLKQTIASFTPEGKIKAFGTAIGGLASGFTAAQGAMAMFGSSGKAMEEQLVKIQAAMAFSSGIQGVIGLGDALKDVVKVLGLQSVATKVVAAAQWLWNAAVAANPIGAIIAGVVALVAAINYFTNATEEATISQEEHNRALEREQELLEKIEVQTKKKGDLTEAMLKAQGASDDQILATKISNLLKEERAWTIAYHNKYLIAKAAEDQLNALVKSGGSDEDIKAQKEKTQKLYDELAIQFADKNKFQEAIALLDSEARTKDRLNADKEVEENRKKNEQKAKDNKDARDKENKEKEIQSRWEDDQIREGNQRIRDEDAKLKQDLLDAEKKDTDEYSKQYFIDVENERKAAEEKKKINDELNNIKVQGIKASLDLTQTLTDLAFAHQLKQAHGNAAKERAIRKKQFQINKAFAVSQIVLDTVMGMIKAFASSPPPSPLGVAGMIATGVAGTAATVKALATKFNDGGGGGGGDIGSLGSGGGGVALEAPRTGSSQLNPDGTIKQLTDTKTPIIKAFVTETDITQSQQHINSIENKAHL